MSRILRPVRCVVRAVVGSSVHLTDAVTGRLPAFRWERWTGKGRWLLTSRPVSGRQPASSQVRLWGLGRLTLLHVSI